MLFGTYWIALMGLLVIYIPIIIHSTDVTKISNDDSPLTYTIRIFFL